MSLTVAQQLADLLSTWGVKFIFGTAGDSILPFLACLGEHSLQFVQLRNEESAAYAASAYAKLTGGLGVVLSHGGPGAGHLINGLADAFRDRVPVLAITGQVDSIYLGTGHKQYINQQQLLGAVTLRSENLGNPASLLTVVTDLLRTAISGASPVHLSIPRDYWQQKVQPAQMKPEPYLNQLAQSPDEVIGQAGEWLKSLKKPMLLVGRGAWQAMDEVLAVAEKLGAGVVHTLPMVGIMPQHPLVVGGIGDGGSEVAVELIRKCDGLIKVGATYWPTALTSDDKKVLAIDVHPANLSRGIPAGFGVVGDAKVILAKLLNELDSGVLNQAWCDQVQKQADTWRQRLEQEVKNAPEGHPGRAIRALAEYADAKTLICLDVGDHVLWFNRFFQGKGQRVLVSGRWRGMGFAIGASIAAQLANPKTQVITIIGDGGFSMLMADFISAVELKLPIIFVVMNNRSYAMEANAMKAGGLKPVSVSLRDIRYDQVAEACGGVGYRVTPTELPATLAKIQGTQPVLIDLQIDQIALPTAHL